MRTPYSYDLANCVDDVDSSAWRSVCDQGENPFLDLRFLRAVETSFSGEARLWFAVFRNDGGQPVACTCFSSYLVDCALMAAPWFQKLSAWVRCVRRKFLRFKILLCGVPITTCGNQLAIADCADMERLIPALDALSVKLAKESGCTLISFKEFAPREAARMSGMEDQGFRSARSVVAYSLSGEFGSFDNYLASRSKRTRANIRRHFRKADNGGLTVEQLRGRDGVDQLFTDDVHRLYLNVLDRAHIRFEKVPAEFFRELARQLPDESCFTFLRQEGRIVAFCCGVASRGAHSMLYCGLDYSLNAEADLYFNIIYRGMEAGHAPGVRVVYIGAAADEFKKHMGCQGQPLSIYVKAVRPVMQFLFKQFFGMLFDTTKVPEPLLPELVPALSDDTESDRIAA